MATYTPSLACSAIAIDPLPVSEHFTAQSGAAFDNVLAGSRWRVRLEYRLAGDEIDEYMADVGGIITPGDTWLLRLQTIAAYQTPHAATSGSVNSSVSAQATALPVTIAGGKLAKGGYISVANRLYIARADLAASGNLSVWPPVPKAISASAAIAIANPVIECRLMEAGGVQADRTLKAGGWGGRAALTLESVVP